MVVTGNAVPNRRRGMLLVCTRGNGGIVDLKQKRADAEDTMRGDDTRFDRECSRKMRGFELCIGNSKRGKSGGKEIHISRVGFSARINGEKRFVYPHVAAQLQECRVPIQFDDGRYELRLGDLEFVLDVAECRWLPLQCWGQRAPSI